MTTTPEFGKHVAVLALVEVSERVSNEARVGHGGRAFQHEKVPVEEIHRIFLVLFHRFEPFKPLEWATSPFPPTSP